MLQEVTSYRTSWRRFFAMWFDNIFFLIIQYVVAISMRPLSSNFSNDNLSLIIAYVTITFAVILYYRIWMTGKYGQTIGKMATRINVVDEETEQSPIGFRLAFYRDIPLVIIYLIGIMYLVYIDSLGTDGVHPIWDLRKARSFRLAIEGPFLLWMLVEFIVMVTNDRRRTIHDRLGRSVVIKQVKITKPEDIPA